MKSEQIKPIEPTVELESEFFAMIKEFKAGGRKVMDGIGSIDAENFKYSVKQAKNHAKGIQYERAIDKSGERILYSDRKWGVFVVIIILL